MFVTWKFVMCFAGIQKEKQEEAHTHTHIVSEAYNVKQESMPKITESMKKNRKPNCYLNF